MRTLLYLGAAALVVAFAFWAYQVNYATQSAARHADSLRRAIAEEKAMIAMLKAEWAYLNRPDRLRLLAEEFFPELQLGPMTAHHFGAPTMVSYPRPEEDELDQLTDDVLRAVLGESP